jgi:hypothetical protein
LAHPDLLTPLHHPQITAKLFVQGFKIKQIVTPANGLQITFAVVQQHHAQKVLWLNLVRVSQRHTCGAVAKGLLNRNRELHNYLQKKV